MKEERKKAHTKEKRHKSRKNQVNKKEIDDPTTNSIT